MMRPRHILRSTAYALADGSYTSSLRVNTRGLPGDRHKSKKAWTIGLSWPPSDPLIPDDALDAERMDARRLLRLAHCAASHHPTCSPPDWLGPRRHAEQERLSASIPTAHTSID